jgi:hypothetical protein
LCVITVARDLPYCDTGGHGKSKIKSTNSIVKMDRLLDPPVKTASWLFLLIMRHENLCSVFCGASRLVVTYSSLNMALSGCMRTNVQTDVIIEFVGGKCTIFSQRTCDRASPPGGSPMALNFCDRRPRSTGRNGSCSRSGLSGHSSLY